MACIDHQAHGYGRDQEHGDGGEKRYREARAAGLPVQEGREHKGRGDAHADARPAVARLRQRVGQASREVGGERGGDVGDDLGQFPIRPRRINAIHPRAEFILGQPALHERGPEGPEHLLAVGVGCA